MVIEELKKVLAEETVDSQQREYASSLIDQIKTCFGLINQIKDDFLSDKKYDFRHHMMKRTLPALIGREGNNQSPKEIVFSFLADYVNNIAEFLKSGVDINADYTRQLKQLIADLETIRDNS